MSEQGHRKTIRTVTLLIASLFLMAYLAFALAQKIRVTVPEQRPRRVSTLNPSSIIVKSGDNFQKALNKAKAGDTIILEAGATFVGPFYLPDKGAGSVYITIQSSAVANLPSGVRVGPSNAANMPKLISDGSGSSGSFGGASNQPVIGSMPSAHHWKLVGLELVPSSTSSTVKSIVQLETFGQGPGNTSQIPHHIIIDRCYIHSLSGDTSVVRGIALNSTDSEVTNSYISEIHGSITDSQAIFAYNTPGRLTITNNYLEAASECLQLGYTTADTIPPDDVTITRNHITRPLAWRSLYGNVKNLFEMKGGTNVTFSGNLLENNWADGQTGHAVVLSAYENNIHDVTITNNIIRHIGAGFSIFGFPVPPFTGGSGSQHGGTAERITISNNLIYDLDPVAYNDPNTGINAGGFFLSIGATKDVTFNHNTNVEGGDIRIGGNDFVISPHFTFTNNIAGTVNGSAILETIARNSGVIKNNIQPAQAGFVDPSNGNYRLSSRSSYKGKGTDGKDMGADFDVLNAALGVSIAPFGRR